MTMAKYGRSENNGGVGWCPIVSQYQDVGPHACLTLLLNSAMQKNTTMIKKR
jgi:hypothetical protein